MQTETDVLVIGTGFSGLGTAIRLRQAGHEDFIVLEQAANVGGTWRDNHYPGVACDVPAHLYSFSFEANPRWSKLFAEQREILAYLDHCADKYGVRPFIRFHSEVTRAVFHERLGRWEVSTKDGHSYLARVIVSACGGLSRPSYPDIPGVEKFRGEKFHTARWNHAYPFEGKRVAVIGTGASAIQVVPKIAKRVAQLVLFQRTPPWVLPKLDLRIGARQRQRFADHPWLQRALRNFIYLFLESRALGFTNAVPAMQANAQKQAEKFLAAQVPDPVLRAKLTPNYRLGCKRILLSNDWYATLQRPNVSTVSEGIAEMREHSVITRDGLEHAVDAIVFATGFQAAESVAPFDIYGRAGHRLNDQWREGAEAYLGTTVSGFPNLFTLMGPNTGLGHNSMVFIIESQIQYVMDSLRTMRERKLGWVDVKAAVQKTFNERLRERLARTVWATGGCVSWYQTRTGKNTTLWPGYTFEYRLRTRRFDVENYETRRELHNAAAPRRVAPRTEVDSDSHLQP
jgi:cation diffusion facilitator CzcD-associated flavoprotein CzcO